MRPSGPQEGRAGTGVPCGPLHRGAVRHAGPDTEKAGGARCPRPAFMHYPGFGPEGPASVGAQSRPRRAARPMVVSPRSAPPPPAGHCALHGWKGGMGARAGGALVMAQRPACPHPNPPPRAGEGAGAACGDETARGAAQALDPAAARWIQASPRSASSPACGALRPSWGPRPLRGLRLHGGRPGWGRVPEARVGSRGAEISCGRSRALPGHRPG